MCKYFLAQSCSVARRWCRRYTELIRFIRSSVRVDLIKLQWVVLLELCSKCLPPSLLIVMYDCCSLGKWLDEGLNFGAYICLYQHSLVSEVEFSSLTTKFYFTKIQFPYHYTCGPTAVLSFSIKLWASSQECFRLKCKLSKSLAEEEWPLQTLWAFLPAAGTRQKVSSKGQ